ncbi:hypothetical protein A1F94_009922 [Pyrenophora tritici-repentis]|nr:hypothetical protein A1F99_119020 [Pyrenophora tritici-repentis]KAG9379566.1 hypothetical protein A1F94_009922 [Pyrenophora tritici-repentis]PZD34331.1 hypothetical protein A1F96_01584 [Pyrenophora tritici-repentis]
MSSASAPPPASPSGKPIDPILRNALRYTISAKEYQLLHQYLLSRAPVVKKRSIHPKRYDAIAKGPDDYNVAAFRAALRLGVVTLTGLKAWELIQTKLLSRAPAKKSATRTSLWKSPNSLLSNEARSFRRRNPRISRSLTSRLAPAIGSSLAGFFLAVYPGDQLRVTIAIYIMTRALEFLYNYLEELGYFKNSPNWFGSWLIMPVACGQLLHAFVFDRDCFPAGFGDHLMRNSPEYVQKRPKGYPAHLPWPGTLDIVDNLAEISRQRWPPFVSPILFPAAETLPKSLSAIAPITSPAHPAIKSLSCALLHPQDPSCLRTYIQYWIQAFPRIARFFTVILSVMSIAKYKNFVNAPITSMRNLAKTILRMTIFLSGAIGTSWGSICLMQNLLPRSLLATHRWFLGGFVGGLWGFLARSAGRGNYLYMARLSIDSAWKVGVKRRWWKAIKNGDVCLFVVSLAVVNALYER